MRRNAWQLVAALTITALILKMIPWILLLCAIAGITWAIQRARLALSDRIDEREALIARCDQQHRWVMRGDPRGTYGQPHRRYPAQR